LARVARVAAIALNGISSIFSTSAGISAVASASAIVSFDASRLSPVSLMVARYRLALADGEFRHANILLLR
jgi:hypothetical protein